VEPWWRGVAPSAAKDPGEGRAEEPADATLANEVEWPFD
jgi:hypothetical protein